MHFPQYNTLHIAGLNTSYSHIIFPYNKEPMIFDCHVCSCMHDMAQYIVCVRMYVYVYLFLIMRMCMCVRVVVEFVLCVVSPPSPYFFAHFNIYSILVTYPLRLYMKSYALL